MPKIDRPNLNELSAVVAREGEERGWTIDSENRLEVAAYVSLIAGEAFEALDEWVAWRKTMGGGAELRIALQTEFADAFIRMLHVAHRFEVDAEAAFVRAQHRSLLYPDFQLLAQYLAQFVAWPAHRIHNALRQHKPAAEIIQARTREIGEVLAGCVAISNAIDPERSFWSVVAEKQEKNRGRPPRHGKVF